MNDSKNVKFDALSPSSEAQEQAEAQLLKYREQLDKSFTCEEKEELNSTIYPEIEKILGPRRKKLGEIIDDQTKLPTKQDVIDAFPFYDFGDYENRPMLDAWIKFWKHHKIYEVITEELIENLSDLIVSEIERLSDKIKAPIKILEAGAGNGKLSYHLNKRLSERGVEFEILAVDDESWLDEGVNLGENVTKMDYKDALGKYKPNIVLQSWMPPGKDFSKDFRRTSSVQSYILIGPPFDTGTPETWGVPKKIIKKAIKQVKKDVRRSASLDDSLARKMKSWFQKPSDRMLGSMALSLHGAMYYEEEPKVKIDDFTMEYAPESLSSNQVSRTYSDELSKTLVFRRNIENTNS